MSGFIESETERALGRVAEQRRQEMIQAIDRYVEAQLRYQIRKDASGELPPRWLDLTKPGDLNASRLVLNFLKHRASTGAKLNEICAYLQRSGKDMKRTSVMTTLGRLRNAGKITRKTGGKWIHAEFS